MTRGEVVMMPVGADIFASTCEALVDPVDCTGAQGKGLALAFRRRFPAPCATYREACRAGATRIGLVAVVGHGAKAIVFFPTKRHWREPSRLVDIVAGLADFWPVAIELRLTSIAIPALGCGEGNLDWSDVRPLLVDAAERMAETGVRVEIYPPHEAPRRKR